MGRGFYRNPVGLENVQRPGMRSAGPADFLFCSQWDRKKRLGVCPKLSTSRLCSGDTS